MVCEVSDIIKENAIIRVPNGNKFLVNVSKNVKGLKAGDFVLCEQKNLSVIRKVHTSKKFNVEQFVIMEKPTVSWNDIGGLNPQIRELQEVVELPLKKPQLFKKMGIQPPKGVLLYGPPGTGKTLLAKAVAKSTKSSFIEIVGSELVQKFIGEGAKLVKEIFQMARQKAPSIIFVDELDSIAATRIEVGTSGEREVQRTFMQFLAELDGFKPLDNVKVIGCTNRKDILDPAVVRPGRLDRLIYVPIPDKKGLKKIFSIHTKNMKLNKRINMEKVLRHMKGFSGAEVKAACTEAGYFAIRKNRTNVSEADVIDAIKKVKMEEKLEGADYMHMFG
jgi:proteasome regulatory subunit